MWSESNNETDCCLCVLTETFYFSFASFHFHKIYMYIFCLFRFVTFFNTDDELVLLIALSWPCVMTLHTHEKNIIYINVALFFIPFEMSKSWSLKRVILLVNINIYASTHQWSTLKMYVNFFFEHFPLNDINSINAQLFKLLNSWALLNFLNFCHFCYKLFSIRPFKIAT